MAVVCLGETWNITGIGGPAIATFENQRYRASDLNLIVAIITFWNTVYLERAVTVLREHGITNDESLAHLLPISWEHINLIGDSPKQPAGRLREGLSGLHDLSQPQRIIQILLAYDFDVSCGDPYSAIRRSPTAF